MTKRTVTSGLTTLSTLSHSSVSSFLRYNYFCPYSHYYFGFCKDIRHSISRRSRLHQSHCIKCCETLTNAKDSHERLKLSSCQLSIISMNSYCWSSFYQFVHVRYTYPCICIWNVEVAWRCWNLYDLSEVD